MSRLDESLLRTKIIDKLEAVQNDLKEIKSDIVALRKNWDDIKADIATLCAKFDKVSQVSTKTEGVFVSNQSIIDFELAETLESCLRVDGGVFVSRADLDRGLAECIGLVPNQYGWLIGDKFVPL
jgi:hypothetical protein